MIPHATKGYVALQTKGFVHHVSPGHGWFEVDKSQLETLGIEKEITQGSYMNGDKAYLEEDCDLVTFIKAMQAAIPEWEFEGSYSTEYCDAELWTHECDGPEPYAFYQA